MSQENPNADERPNEGEVTRVLAALQGNDRRATDELLSLVYRELRRLARSRLSDEPNAGAGLTLDATSLVHEAYLRLLGPAASANPMAEDGRPVRWQNRGHFFGAAALAMRRILVERARHQKRIKHGGQFHRVQIDEARDAVAEPTRDYDGMDLVALDAAIAKLEQLDERKAKIVSLRYFAGLSVQETAAAMDVSPATVKNDWAFARAWLCRELGGSDSE